MLTCTLEDTNGAVRSVAVQMGWPRLTPKQIPLAPGGETGPCAIPSGAATARFQFTAVSMGNPHAVIFVDGEADCA